MNDVCECKMYTKLKILKPLRAAQRIVITGALMAVPVASMAGAQEPSTPAAAGPTGIRPGAHYRQ